MERFVRFADIRFPCLQISPVFKKKFAAIQHKRCTKHPFERIQVPCQIHPWLSPRFEHAIDYFRAEDGIIRREFCMAGRRDSWLF